MLGLFAISGCAYQGGDIGNPLTRKFHWFSFIEGEDIRASCAPGTPDRYRVVYNGIYDEQLRIYELDGLRRVLVANVTHPGVEPLTAPDILEPWRAATSRRQLDAAAYESLVAAFAASGMFEPPPVGLELPARSYFWTAAMCKDGRYAFTAWKAPSPAFDRLSFPARLFELDDTGVAVNAPKPVPFDPMWEQKARRNEVPNFTLKVGRNGLVG
ncbi:MAG: hypothetical protein ACM33T_09950 [Solirubrobacterales bacterium]